MKTAFPVLLPTPWSEARILRDSVFVSTLLENLFQKHFLENLASTAFKAVVTCFVSVSYFTFLSKRLRILEISEARSTSF